MRGAYDAGARYFLAPAGNCAEANRNKVKGLTLMKVTTLDSALDGVGRLAQRHETADLLIALRPSLRRQPIDLRRRTRSNTQVARATRFMDDLVRWTPLA